VLDQQQIDPKLQRQAKFLAIGQGELEHSIDGYAKLLCELVTDIGAGHEDSTEFKNIARFVCMGNYRLGDPEVRKRVAANALAIAHALGLRPADIEEMSKLENGRLARLKNGEKYPFEAIQVIYLANELKLDDRRVRVPLPLLFEDFANQPEALKQALIDVGVLPGAEGDPQETDEEVVAEPEDQVPTDSPFAALADLQPVDAQADGDPLEPAPEYEIVKGVEAADAAQTPEEDDLPGDDGLTKPDEAPAEEEVEPPPSEVSADSILGQALPVKISRVVQSPDNPRKHFLKGSIESLADAIEDEGQETAIVVFKDPDVPGQFVLHSGERRWRAVHRIWERRGGTPEVEPTIDCIIRIREGTSLDRFLQAFMENEHREDMCPLDKALTFAKLYAGGVPVAKLAKAMDYKPPMVYNYIAVAGLPEEVKALMDPNLPEDRQLKISAAIMIATKVPDSDPQMQIRLARAVVDGKLTVAKTNHLIDTKVGTGGSGFVQAGHEEAPSHRFRRMSRYVSRTRDWIGDFLKSGPDPIHDALFNRDDETEVRAEMARDLRITINRLNEFLEIVEKPPEK